MSRAGRIILSALLVLVVSAPLAHAGSEPREVRDRHENVAAFMSRLWHSLARIILPREGASLDPNGGTKPSSVTTPPPASVLPDEGASLDPNGGGR